MIDDEKILSALLSAGSIRRAAKTAGCSEATVRDRLKNPSFRERYDQEKSSILQEASDSIAAKLTGASDCLSDIMDDEEITASVRCSAADALLRHGLRYVEQAEILRRLEALEQAQNL